MTVCYKILVVNNSILLCIKLLVGSGRILATLLTKPMSSPVSTTVTSSRSGVTSAFSFSAKPAKPSTGSISLLCRFYVKCGLLVARLSLFIVLNGSSSTALFCLKRPYFQKYRSHVVPIFYITTSITICVFIF